MSYQIIYADPPWKYRDKAKAGNRGAEDKYPCMTVKQLCALPVRALAAKDCALLLWATFPTITDALKVMSAWGFRYTTTAFVWVKHYPRCGTEIIGMGNYTRANAEVVLLGVRGRPRRVSKSVCQIVHAPRGRHSQKPDEVRRRIVTLMGNLPRIELFAREHPEGWKVWGNEVECSDLFEVTT